MSDEYLEHEAAGMPPVLAFPYERVLEGTRSNYSLVHITDPQAGTRKQPINQAKRPVVIVDPRALMQFVSRLFIGQSLTPGQQAAFREIETALGQTEHRASLD